MLKCFVACAFGKAEVDKIYEKVILPVLKEKNIMPLRVDKIEHNDNIDLKIMELIRQSNFCISDLTYARPSVYYEAGYSSGLGNPVIYTVRKDHFAPKESDKFGNMKVHFDLQMKNIIGWTSDSDFATFKKTFTKRIDHVCRPLWKKEVINQEIETKKKEFMMLSVFDRVQKIREAIQNFLIKKGWNPYFIGKYHQEKNSPDYFRKGKKIIKPMYFDSATQQNMSCLLGYKDYVRELIKKGYESHFYVIALRKIPSTRIESTFTSSTTIDYCRVIKISTYSGDDYFIHFISGLGYPEQYMEEFISQTKLC